MERKVSIDVLGRGDLAIDPVKNWNWRWLRRAGEPLVDHLG